MVGICVSIRHLRFMNIETIIYSDRWSCWLHYHVDAVRHDCRFEFPSRDLLHKVQRIRALGNASVTES